MKTWDISTLELRPHAPRILSSTDDARAIAIAIPAGAPAAADGRVTVSVLSTSSVGAFKLRTDLVRVSITA